MNCRVLAIFGFLSSASPVRFVAYSEFWLWDFIVALFLSTVTNKVDKKGRVSVPATFRAALMGQLDLGVVIFASSQHSCLEGFDWATMHEISQRLDHYDLFSPEQDDLATSIFGESVQLTFDSEGRVTLPAELMRTAGIDDAATFVGLGRKFQIWNPALFEARKIQARTVVREKGLTVPKGGNDGR